MNTLIKGLVLSVLTLSAQHVSAHTNKTFLMPHPVGVNMALQKNVTKQAMCSHEADKAYWGSTVSVAAAYQESRKADELGKYFNFGDKAENTLSTAQAGLIVPGLAGTDNTIKFAPKQRLWAADFMYHQALDKILEGLHFCIHIPLVQVEQEMGLHVSGADAAKLKEYFAGKGAVSGGTAGAIQALDYARINGKHKETAIADIDLMLGYKFLNKDSYHAGINLGVVVPTGNEAKGIDAFEPIVGANKHWGFGAGLHFGAELWESKNTEHAISLQAGLKYRYLFKGSERRTFGYKDEAFGQYGIAIPAANATDVRNIQAIPMANLLTQNVDVTPGSQLDGIAGFTYNHKNWTMSLDYELFFKEKETVTTRDSFDSSKYVRVTDETDAAQIGGAGGVPIDISARTEPITKADFNVNAAATPSALDHKIHGGIGYIFKDWQYPVHLGAGAHYSFANKNSSIENWGLHVKGGISF